MEPNLSGVIGGSEIINALVPTDVIDPANANPVDIIAQPEVTTTLPPANTDLPSILSDLTPPPKTGIKSVDDENYENYLKLLQTYRLDLFIDEEDDYVAPIKVDSDSDTNLPAIEPEEDNITLPIDVDTDNIILKDDGDAELIDPENMQTDDRSITLKNEGVVALPKTEKMEDIRTINLVLKRKNDNEPDFGNNEMIKNDTDILVRDVVPYASRDLVSFSDTKDVVPYSNVKKHLIQRKMEKDMRQAKKQARLVKSRVIDVHSLDDVSEPRIKNEWSGFPSVDIATMNRIPWVDFNNILDTTDKDKREEVILDLLQNNLPADND